jgi:predicted tellurium resistance membrane protein TerC
MLELLLMPEIWLSLLTLTFLEIVLGIDNIIFLSIVSSRLKDKIQQKRARQIGLFLALAGRIAFLFSVTWIMTLKEPLFTIKDFAMSWRDIILCVGGLFLLYKGTMEIHAEMEGHDENADKRKPLTFAVAITQIAVLDVIFALDSMITAIGLSEHLWVMIAANVIAMIVMLIMAEKVSAFIQKHPSIKMLALSFLILVGTALLADAFHYHIPRGFIYFAIAFSIATETLNITSRHKSQKRRGRKAE